MQSRPALRRQLALFLIVLTCFFTAAPVKGAASPDEVEKAIKKGRAFLLSKQKTMEPKPGATAVPAGRWESDDKRDPKTARMHGEWQHMQGPEWGGFTAIATYALLASSQDLKTDLEEPRIKAAVTFLKKADILGIYSVGLRAQIWQFLPDGPERRQMAARDAGILFRGLNSKGKSETFGLWDYDDPTNNGVRIDHSVSQYGVLGLWAALQAGANIVDADSQQRWKSIETTWRNHQYPSGGWSYKGDGKDSEPVTASMTAAGVATLFITQDFLLRDAGIGCKESLTSKHIELGLKWMDEHFNEVGGNTYTLYGVERIGAASGLKYFGSKDWYETGAESLVRSQKEDGSWHDDRGDLPATSFAVLFLSRGRAAIAINKLQYTSLADELPSDPAKAKAVPAAAPAPGAQPGAGGEDDMIKQGSWNQRPRDIANVARWISKNTEGEIGWQIVNMKVTSNDLHDAPVLYISGSTPISLTPEDVAKLREYVEGGGLILGHANCGKQAFTTSFKKLIAQVLPKYEFRELPSSHPIYTNQPFLAEKWKNRPSVLGVSNGVRELVLLVPAADPGKAWQTRRDDTNPEAYQLATNIVSYALDRNFKLHKGERYVVNDAAGTADRTIKVLRLISGTNPDPEPGGWRRLGNVMKNQLKVALAVTPGAPTPAALKDVQVAHLTGTAKFNWKPEERSAIKAFVEQGGTLLVDAAGGSSEFADAAQDELAATFGPAAKEQLGKPLPAEHLIYNLPQLSVPLPKGTDNWSIYRPFARNLIGATRAPRVRAITVGAKGRVGVFFSREDLSAGLVGGPVDGIIGYGPATATLITRNILLYAASGGTATTRPTTAPAAGDPLAGDPRVSPPAAASNASSLAQPKPATPAPTKPGDVPF